MPVMLEVAIGLVFVYLVLSLLCSAIAETVEHYFHYRADYLRQGIEKLLLAGDGPLRDKLYGHPLIKCLYTSSKLEGKGRSGGPAYIPSRQFVLAFLDIVTDGKAPSGTSPASFAAHFREAIDANKSLPEPVKRALRTMTNDAGDDMEKIKTNIQQWFDSSMDRVAGWYKGRAEFVLLIIGTLVAVLINVDTLSIINTLSNDSAVRLAVVNAAETYARENPRPSAPGDAGGGTQPASSQPGAASKTEDQLTADVRTSVERVTKQLGALGLPVGWRFRDSDPGGIDEGIDTKTPRDQKRYRLDNRIWPTTPGEWGDQLGSHLLGWLLTAFALSFGAPFWFDMLNKIMVIRSTVKPREKSGEEGSEDRPLRGTQTVGIASHPAKP